MIRVAAAVVAHDGPDQLGDRVQILEEIVDRILRDCDYQSSNDLMDLPPDVARQVREVVGIDEE